MKDILKLEAVGLFILSIFLFRQLPYSWWWFPALLLVPDLSMIGYLLGNKTGAILYNLAHHQGIAVVIYLCGVYFKVEPLALAGVILLAHSTMDRIFGYGLKHFTGFQYTHLGMVGKQINQP